jgi:hypothetical protein
MIYLVRLVILLSVYTGSFLLAERTGHLVIAIVGGGHRRGARRSHPNGPYSCNTETGVDAHEDLECSPPHSCPNSGGSFWHFLAHHSGIRGAVVSKHGRSVRARRLSTRGMISAFHPNCGR